ncbi:xanthine dehydrogenase family protein molybdopterin-binding subunit [Mangrovactinospora gilvigrisea]|uniref:xanthine dehydrogenase family protein molybdopterin-binding subunit n=1 Tax=Mangrovactinospora gilvigrisea TaxID=1428644 RepID=UPI000AE1098C
MTTTEETPAEGVPAQPGGAEEIDGLGASPMADTAMSKAMGTYPFATDLWAEGLLWGTLVRSPHPHARIVRINTESAFRLPGVQAVVTAADIPGDPLTGEPVADRPVLARDVVRHHGEPVAAVAADHPDTARLAAAAVEVEYELLEPVPDPERSFHAPPLHPDGNQVRHLPLRFGAPDDPAAVGEVVVEGLYRIGRQDPAPVGTEAGLAVPRPDGGVELHLSSTDPHGDRDRAAAFLGLEPERVRLVAAGVPGAVGEREDISLTAALGLLALRTGRPVKMAFSREDALLGHVHRHPAVLRYRHHADRDGRLIKVEGQLVLDGGPYADGSEETLATLVALAAGPYVVPHVRVDGWVMRTTNPPAGRLPGEGALQACFGYEAQMDKLAAKLGLDPVEMRARNVLATGDIMPTSQTVTCPAPVADLLKAVMAEPLPEVAADGGEELLPGGTGGAADLTQVRRGIGFAVGMVPLLGIEGADEVSTATVRVLPVYEDLEGAASGVECVVECAAVDTGSGFATLAAQIVRETLGVVRVRVTGADSDQPAAGPSARGRQVWVSGGAVERAAGMVRKQLLQPMADELGMSVELLSLRDDRVVSYDGRYARPIGELLGGRELWASAQYRPHPTEPLDENGQGDAFAGLAFAAMRAVVDVDVELGSVRVVEVAVAQDVGRALNPRQVRARIEAGVTLGVGAALMEDLRTDAGGRVVNASFGGYRVPTALDAPVVRVAALLEERDVVATFGAKGVGAVPAVVTPAAVAAAVRSATGRAVQRVPVRSADAVERRS